MAYKKLVLQNTLRTIPGITPKEERKKKVKSQKPALPEVVVDKADDEDGVFGEVCYSECLSNEARK